MQRPNFYLNSFLSFSQAGLNGRRGFFASSWRGIACILFLCCAANFAKAQAPSFATKVDFTVNASSDLYNVGIADFDGDGKKDLVTPGRSNNRIYVLRNTSTIGALGFAAATNFTPSTNPQFVAVGDIDGDGKIDVAVSNDNGNNVSVFRNTSSGVGNINFAFAVNFATNNNPRGLVIGDLDNDGKNDIAVCCGGGTGLLCVFRNTSTSGSISFAARNDFTTTQQVWGLALGDLDGDGKNDLAIGAYNQSKLSLFRNISSGAGNINFATRIDIGTGSGTQPLNLSMGDLDGDGKKDIVIPDVAGANVFVFRNTSSTGALSFATQVNYTIGAAAFEAKIADVNLDGKLDIVTANLSTAAGVSVLINNCTTGNINFNAKVDFATAGTPQGGSISDLDGDGLVDIVTSNSGSGTVSVLRNTGSLPLPTITSFTPSSGTIGTLVTITGTNLSSPSALSIGGVAAIPISNNGTTLVAMLMPGATTGNIAITVAGGSTTSGSNFTVTAAQVPTTQQGNKLVGTGSAGGAYQGSSVSLSADGNTAIVGGYNDNGQQGAAWIYIRSGATWTQQGSKLVGTGAVGAAAQGYSVSLSADGNTAIVGGYADNSNQGAAWIFTRSGSTWTQQGNKLVGTGNVGTAFQGASVSISADGNTAIVGGYFDSSQQGAAWVYTRSGSTWTQQGNKLVGTGNVGPARQGTSVSVSADGNTAIVGGYTDNGQQGATWIYTRSGGTWTQQGSKLVGTGAVGAAAQGISVSLSADGNTAIIGGGQDNSAQGAVWIFTRSGGTWAQQGNKLVGTGNIGTAQQGNRVSLSADGNTAIVGGSQDNAQQGAAWIFTRSGNTWTQQGSKLVGTGNVGIAQQGSSVSLSADGLTAISSGSFDNNSQGAVWVFIPQPAPTISSFTPTSGCISTTSVVITGTGFTNVSAVTIGGTAVTSYTVNSPTQITATIGSGTTGTIAVTTLGGTGTSSGTFTVNPLPVFTLGATSSRCQGAGTVGYAATNAVSYSLTGGGSSSINTSTGQVTWDAAFSGSATITAIGAGCNVTHVVTVNPLTAAPTITGGTSPVCVGASVTLTGAGVGGTATQFSWYKNGTLVNSDTQADYTFPALLGSNDYTLVVVYGGSCPSSVSSTTTVVGVTPPVFTLGATSTRCQGAGTVSYAATNAVSYSLTGGGSSSINTSTGDVTWDGTFSGSATITAIGSGCNVTHDVTVNPLAPAPTITGGTSPVCVGASVTLTGAGVGGTATQFSWYKNGTLVYSDTQADYTFAALLGSNDYTLVVSYDGVSCLSAVSSTTTVVGATPPVFTLGATSTRCQEGGFLSYTATDAVSYSLTGGAGSIIDSGTGDVFWDSGFSGSATITAIGSGCDATHEVTVNPLAPAPTITGGNTMICMGTPVTLTGVGTGGTATQFRWYKNGNLVYMNSQADYTFSPFSFSFDNYTLVVYYDGVICPSSVSYPSYVVAVPPPVFGLGGSSTRCQGAGTVSYAATDALSYSLTGGGTSTIDSGTGEVSWDAAFSGSATITAMGQGCDVTHEVTVNPAAPAPTITGGNNIVCIGASVTLTGVGTGGTVTQFTWYRNGMLVNTGTQADYTFPAYPGPLSPHNQYTLVVNYDGVICPSSVSSTIFVAAVPVPGFSLGASSTRCQGAGTVSYAATNAASYSLTGGGASTIDSGTGEVSWDAAFSGSATITAIGSGCNTTHVVTVNPLTTAPTITGGNSPVCVGESVTLTGVGTGSTATEFSWYKNGTLVYNDTQADYTFPALAGANDYTLVVVYGGSCPSSVSSTATVVGFAQPVFTLGGSSTRCQGVEKVSYAATNALSYSLTGGGASTINTSTGEVTWDGTFSGSATITAIGAGCNASHSVSITAAPPTPTISSTNTSVCVGASVTLTGVGTGGTATEFAWFKNGVYVKYDTQPNYTFNATAGANNYTLVVIYGGSCPSTVSSTATVVTGNLPAAVITASVAPPYCVGAAPTLMASTGTNYTYSWIGSSPSAATTTTSTFVPTTSGNHRVIVTDGNGCSKSSGWTGVVLNALPAIYPGVSQATCVNNAVSIGAANNASLTYSWTPSTDLSSATVSNPTVMPTAIGTINYTLTVSNAIGCKNTGTISITTAAQPATPTLTGTSSPVCQGTSITLTPSGVAGAVNWYKEGVLNFAASTNAARVFSTVNTGAENYTIRAKVGTCLSDVSNAVPVEVKAAPVPTLSATPAIISNLVSVCNPGQTSGTAQLMVNLPSGAPTATYNWQQVVSGNATNVNPAATTSTYTVSVASTPSTQNNKVFRAVVTYSNGCVKNTANVMVKLLPSTCTRMGHTADLGEMLFIAYPNPTENVLNVSIQNSAASEGELMLYNTLGQVVTSRIISLDNGSIEESLDLSGLASGVYTLSFQTKDGNQVQKIVKE